MSGYSYSKFSTSHSYEVVKFALVSILIYDTYLASLSRGGGGYINASYQNLKIPLRPKALISRQKSILIYKKTPTFSIMKTPLLLSKQ